MRHPGPRLDETHIFAKSGRLVEARCHLCSKVLFLFTSGVLFDRPHIAINCFFTIGTPILSTLQSYAFLQSARPRPGPICRRQRISRHVFISKACVSAKFNDPNAQIVHLPTKVSTLTHNVPLLGFSWLPMLNLTTLTYKSYISRRMYRP